MQAPRPTKLPNYISMQLNPQQQSAVTNILLGVHFPAPYIVFGPPGTGKVRSLLSLKPATHPDSLSLVQTRTITSAIHCLIKQYPNTRILASAPSNSAADEIAKRLIDPGEMQLKRDELFRFNAVSRTLPANIPELEPYWSLSSTETILDRCQKARVIIVTCVHAGQLYAAGLQALKFSHIFGTPFTFTGILLANWLDRVVVDEASQCTEPEWLVPMQLRTEETRVIMAGDHKQLGPVIRSPICKVLGLATSKLEQLMTNPSLPIYQRSKEGKGEYNHLFVTKLVNNYRYAPFPRCQSRTLTLCSSVRTRT